MEVEYFGDNEVGKPTTQEDITEYGSDTEESVKLEESTEEDICYVCQQEFKTELHTKYKNHECKCNTFLCDECLPKMLEKNKCTICKTPYSNNEENDNKSSSQQVIRVVVDDGYSSDESEILTNRYYSLRLELKICNLLGKVGCGLCIALGFFGITVFFGLFTYEAVRIFEENAKNTTNTTNLSNSTNNKSEEEIDFGSRFGFIVLYGLLTFATLFIFAIMLICCIDCFCNRRRSTIFPR
mgnify:CR=1 FL=1|tara:strand:+ start:236 stop:955 length:720 start_codon:yes stop_codon:yes gene_type:complete